MLVFRWYVSFASHRLQCAIQLQSLQIMTGAKPRRLMKDKDLLSVCEPLTNLVAQCPSKSVFMLQLASIQEFVAFRLDAGWARRKVDEVILAAVCIVKAL